jgi:hypothetical protein
MALNKVNIEFLRKQMDKVLNDIEKLKDANREINITRTGVTHNDRVNSRPFNVCTTEKSRNTWCKKTWHIAFAGKRPRGKTIQ